MNPDFTNTLADDVIWSDNTVGQSKQVQSRKEKFGMVKVGCILQDVVKVRCRLSQMSVKQVSAKSGVGKVRCR